MKVSARKGVRLKRRSQPAQAGPIAQPMGLFGMVAPQGGVGLMGGLMHRQAPKPTHAVTYAPGMANAPEVKKARAKVAAGRGPPRVNFVRHSKTRGGKWG